MRQPLGVAVFGGLVVSQFLTLYLTPVLFLLFDDLSKRLRTCPPKQAKVSLTP